MATARLTRLGAMVVLAVALCAPVACGPRAEVPAASCATIAWGGWDATPQCAGIAAVIINGADRACRSHADCVLVGVNRCSAHSVNQAAIGRFQQYPPPCEHPLAVVCPQSPQFVACHQGCCVPSQTPPPM